MDKGTKVHVYTSVARNGEPPKRLYGGLPQTVTWGAAQRKLNAAVAAGARELTERKRGGGYGTYVFETVIDPAGGSGVDPGVNHNPGVNLEHVQTTYEVCRVEHHHFVVLSERDVIVGAENPLWNDTTHPRVRRYVIGGAFASGVVADARRKELEDRFIADHPGVEAMSTHLRPVIHRYLLIDSGHPYEEGNVYRETSFAVWNCDPAVNSPMQHPLRKPVRYGYMRRQQDILRLRV
jgi:hypothetical protein